MRDVITRRVERLGNEAREVLTLAAVIGRSFELELLGRLVETPESELLDRLETAVTASLLDESTEQVGRFRFVHALINQTLYEGLGATRRSSIHHRVAIAFEEWYGQERVAELALHWRLAGTDKPKAARYSALAGRQALDSLAPAEAAKLFADALDLLGPADDAERCGALIGLGEAQQLTGDRGLPHDAAAGGADRLVARRRRSGRSRRAREHPRLHEPDRRPRRRTGGSDRTRAGARRRCRSRPAGAAAGAAVAGASVRARSDAAPSARDGGDRAGTRHR